MEANVRIDKGIKRGPKGMQPAQLPKVRLKMSKVENEARERARNEAGQLVPTYSDERRESAIDAVQAALERGLTVGEIAKQQGIPQSTLYSWIVSDNRASQARTMFFARMVTNAIDHMEGAPDPLELARGRELAKVWKDLAAVRDPANYGPKNYVTVENVGDLGDKLRRARERSIDGEAQTVVDANVISDDKHS